jgi:hypothetical protein
MNPLSEISCFDALFQDDPISAFLATALCAGGSRSPRRMGTFRIYATNVRAIYDRDVELHVGVSTRNKCVAVITSGESS